MPPTRRSRNSSGPAPNGSQKTLAFSNPQITKPTSTAASKSLADKPVSFPSPPATASVALGHVTPHAAVDAQAQAELQRMKKERTPAEAKAEKVTDAQIRKYWREREAERLAPRVHQEDLSVEVKILRLFDMSSQYGPCIGIARMKRWVRANKLGLAPPIEVLAVLLKEEEKGHTKIDRAHVDELMSSKFVVGEAS